MFMDFKFYEKQSLVPIIKLGNLFKIWLEFILNDIKYIVDDSSLLKKNISEKFKPKIISSFS